VAWACAKVRSWPRQSAAVSLLAPGRGRGKAPGSAAFPSRSPYTPSPILPARQVMPAALRLAASSPRRVAPAEGKTRRDEPGVPDGPWIRVPHAHAARLVQEELVLPATMEDALLDRGHTSVRVKRCYKHFGTPKWGAVHIVSPTPRASLPSVTIPTRAMISRDSWPDTSLGWDRMGLAHHGELWGNGGGNSAEMGARSG